MVLKIERTGISPRTSLLYHHSPLWSIELGFAFLQERVKSFLGVWYQSCRSHNFHRVIIGLRLSEAYLSIESLFADACCDETAPRNCFKQALRLFHKLFGRNYPIYMALVCCRLCIDPVTCEQHFERPFAPNVAGHSHQWRGTEPAICYTRRCESCFCGSDRQVARCNQLAPGGSSKPMYTRKDGLWNLLDCIH